MEKLIVPFIKPLFCWIIIVAPEAFEIVMNLVRPLMNRQTRKVLKIFGTDESKWRPYLEQHFDYDQIADWFGGYKVRKTRN